MTRKTTTLQDLEDRPLYYGQVVTVSTRGYGFLWCEFLKSEVYFCTDSQAKLIFRTSDESVRFSGVKRLSVLDPELEDVLVFRAVYDDQRKNYRATSWVYGRQYIDAQDEFEDLTQFRVVNIKRVKDDPSQDRTEVLWEGRTIENFRLKFPICENKDPYVPIKTFEQGKVRFEMRLEGLYYGKWMAYIHPRPESILPSFVFRVTRLSRQAIK